jgi:hypothetical protein
MRVFELFEDRDVVELDIQVLIDRLEGAPNRNVILELNGHN